MTTAQIKNWLIYAWEYPAEDKFEKKNGKFERTPLFANDVINIPGVADEATRYNLLNHIRSQEELTTQLLCWLLNNNRRFQEVFFYKLCNSVSYADAHIEAEKEFDNDGAKGTYDISLIDQNGRIICIVENKIEASFNDPDKRFRMDLHNGGCIGDSKDPQLPKYLASLCAKRNSASTSMTMVILSKYDVTKEEQFMWLKKHAQQNGIIINCIAWHDVVALLDKCLASNNATVEKEISEFLH